MQSQNLEEIITSDSTNFGFLKKTIIFMRKNNIRIPEVVLNAGLQLMTKYKSRLGDEYFIVLEQVFFSALETQQFKIAELALTGLREQFGDTSKLTRLAGIKFEAEGDRESSEKTYDQLLADNPMNYEVRKRKIALLRVEGDTEKAVYELNKFLEENMMDKEVWLELGDIYLETSNYSKALFCYEQLCILAPKTMHYFLRCADIQYLQQNYLIARSYYSYVTYFEAENLHALYGLLKTCRAIEAKKGDSKNKELLNVALKSIKEVYSKNNSKLLDVLPLANYTNTK